MQFLANQSSITCYYEIMKGSDPLKHNHEKIIAALLSESSIVRASDKLGIDQSTLFRIMQNQSFQSAYNDAKRRIIDNTLNAIQAASGEALETLRYVMNDPKTQPQTRVSAAKMILELSLRAFESQQIDQRLSAIETTLNDRNVISR